MIQRFPNLSTRYRLFASLVILAILVAVNIAQTISLTAATAAGPTNVAIIQTSNSDPSEAEVRQMVRDAVAAAGGLDGIIQPGDKVLIQPNLVNTGFSNGGGVVTDYRVTREVVRVAQELTGASGEVIIAEGTAYTGPFDANPPSDLRTVTRKAFKDASYDSNGDMIDDATGVRLVDLNDAGGTYAAYPGYTGPYNANYVTGVSLQNGLLRSNYWLSNELMTADVVIKVPVFKNHELAGITGALKLAVGTAPNDIYHAYWDIAFKWDLLHYYDPSEEYEKNAGTIVDLNLCRPADFVICDALKGVVNGPVGHNMGRIDSVTMGCIVAGKDMVAVDTIQSLMQGYNPATVRHIVLASQNGLGTMNTADITIKGAHVAQVRKEFSQLDPPDYAGASAAEGVAPNVTSVDPAQGAIVSGTVSVIASGVSDNQGSSALLRAELYVDGQLVAKDTTLQGSAYSVIWDSTSVPDGTHELKIFVYDKFLNEKSFSRTVTVDNSTNPVASALSQPNGTPVTIGQLVVTAVSNGSFFYAELPDRTMGLKVVNGGTYSEGNLVDITGTMAGAGGERYLQATRVTVINPSALVPAPLGLSNASIGGSNLNALTPGVYLGSGLYNIGLLVKTWGRVTSVGSDYFYVSDGSKLPDSSPASVRVKCGALNKPNQNDHVSVTGISIPIGAQAERGLLVRKQTDIVSHPH